MTGDGRPVPVTPPLVSVVVPTVGRRDLIRRLLDALARQTCDPDLFETIIVADGADDGTIELVESFDGAFRLRCVAQPRQGRSSACNTGIAAADGTFVAVLDDDMEPTPGWLDAHVIAHGDDPQRCVLGAVPIVERSGSSPLIQWTRQNFDRHMAKLAEPDHVFSLADFYSGNMSIRRESLVSVGAYDDAFSTLYGNEDLELYARLRGQGIRLSFSADARAWQIYEKTFPRWARETREAGITAVMLSRKHPELSAELVAFRGGRGVWRRINTVLLEVSKRSDILLRLLNAVEPAVTRILPSEAASRFYWYVSNHLFWVGVNEAQADGVRTLRR